MSKFKVAPRAKVTGTVQSIDALNGITHKEGQAEKQYFTLNVSNPITGADYRFLITGKKATELIGILTGKIKPAEMDDKNFALACKEEISGKKVRVEYEQTEAGVTGYQLPDSPEEVAHTFTGARYVEGKRFSDISYAETNLMSLCSKVSPEKALEAMTKFYGTVESARLSAGTVVEK